MTKRERNFQLKVEELLSDISNPEYRQTVVEVSFFIFILQLRDIAGFHVTSLNFRLQNY